MAYIDVYNLKNGLAGTEIRNRAEVALANVAIETLQNVNASAEHKALARQILGDSRGYLERIAWPVFANPTVLAAGSAVTDVQLKAAVTDAIVIFL